MPLTNGENFAGYTIVRLLGSGGMGEVYLVQHPRLPRQEALKVLRPEFSRDASFRERFIREADLAAGLRHPHVVGIHDRGEHDDQLWIAMDYIEGAALSRLLELRYPAGMPVGHVIQIVTAVASALDYAHKTSLLHRDVKPANIIVADLDTDERRIFLADFGIARPLDDTSGITTTNMTVGTVAYAAPEQLMGEQMDGRADQYALGATTYHLLTGSQLFPHSNPAVVISRHLNSPPPALAHTRPELASLDPVLTAALAKDPEDRFPRCTDFARALAEVATQDSASPAAPTTPAPAARIRAGSTPTPKPRAATSTPESNKAGRSRPRVLILLAVLGVFLLLGGVALIWRPWQHGGSVSPEASTSAPPPGGSLTSSAIAAPATVAPFSLAAPVTDDAHALDDTGRSNIQHAVDTLYHDRGIRLYVVYVDNFDQDPVAWTQNTIRESTFGDQGAILAVATEQREYAFLLSPLTGMTQAQVDALRHNEIEPALRRGDWSAAAVAAANGLRTVATP